MERKILKLLMSKNEYSKIRQIIDEQEFSPLGQSILKSIDEYFVNDPNAKTIDKEIFQKNLELKVSEKFKDSIIKAFEYVLDEEISNNNVVQLILKLKKQKIGLELSGRLMQENENEIDKLINTYIEIDTKVKSFFEEDTEYRSISVADAMTKLNIENRIPLFPKALNDRINGGAIRGQNILIFGRPEVGKTLFAINIIRGCLVKGYRVLYVGNEDPISQIVPRIIYRIAEMPEYEIRADPEKAETLIRQRGYDNLYLKESYPGNFYEIKGLVEKYEPDLVVVDQLRHVKVGNLTRVEHMEKVAVEARNLAKKYNIIMIGITQAGDSAEDKLVLEMGDVDFSNTGMQGAMDLIIGIGSNTEFTNSNRRMISLPKNKISGDHSFFPVKYNIPINKVESM